jgi:RES domain-containing protein
LSTTVYRIGTDTSTYQADDLSGKGAELTGGRWNDKGLAVTYASENRSLACLETLVHLAAVGLPLNRYMVEITIPAPVWAAAKRHAASAMPVGWDAEPAGLTSTSFGSAWLRAKPSAVLLVPSVVVAEEFNVLINPAHPDSARVTAKKTRKWLYDPRLRTA